MITAYQLMKANRAIDEATRDALAEMPNAHFVLIGLDSDKIYFNVVCKLSETNEQEIKDIKQKTRFEKLSESTQPIYKGEFAMVHTLTVNGRELY